MRKLIVLLMSVSFLFVSCAKEQVSADYNVIPLPQSIEKNSEGDFVISSNTKISFPAGNEALEKIATFLSEYIEFSTGMKLSTTDNEVASNAIILKTGYASDNKEAYLLTINDEQIVINGTTEAGTFYGVQTLRKSIPVDAIDKDILLVGVEIKDYPRFRYRGMHFDVARHFYSVDFIKKYIDNLALHNINTFHWHLTDDQGWRVEIKKYPKLTEIGSKRKGTLIGHNEKDKPHQFDSIPYGGFYTQDELRDVVQYAKDRFITIIPEIDLPGHMLAALAAYPELGCIGEGYAVGMRWGVYDDVLCAGNDKTFEFVEDVLTEVLDIFPSKLIHIGGDECPKTKWEKCPKCQQRIKELKLTGKNGHTKEQELQSYYMSRVEAFLNEKGRNIIGWDEIIEGGIAPNATIMSWRGIKGGIIAARQGHDVIMTPNNYLYFDYNQGEDLSKEPLNIGGLVSMEKVYGFEPMPEELTEGEKHHIIGVQANLWTEYFKTEDVVEYMQMPRLDALATIQWTMPERKEDFVTFLTRLNKMLAYYDKAGYNYAKHVLKEEDSDHHKRENKE